MAEEKMSLARQHYLRNGAWLMGFEPDADDVAWADGLAKAKETGTVEGEVVSDLPGTAPSSALVTHVPPPPPALPATVGGLPTIEPTAMDAAQVLRRLDVMLIVRQAIKAQLRRNVHYGTQPGVDKPFLWQPGASLIAYCYNVAPAWHKRTEWFDYTDPATDETIRHLTCTVRVDLVSRNTGAVVYPGPERKATSLESRYRVRLKERKKKYKDKATGKYKESQYTMPAEPIEVLQDVIERQSCKRALVDVVRLFSGMDDDYTVEGDVEREDDDTQDGEAGAPKPQSGSKAKAPTKGTGKPTGEQYEELSVLLAAKQSTLSREAEARKWTLPLSQEQMTGLLTGLKAKK